MSTLKATQADGYYIPPNGTGSTLKRMKKSFPSTIRFEMPFHIWCDGCKKKIAKGVRFNAKKKHVGDYLSTKIYAFFMTCNMCQHRIVIKTDPKGCDYIVESGGQKKAEDFTAEQTEAMQLERHEERLKNQDNGFLKLERENKDRKIGISEKPRIEAIIKLNDERKKNDYEINYLMRKKFRAEKKLIKKDEGEVKNFGLNLNKTTLTPDDLLRMKRVKFKAQQNSCRVNKYKIRKKICSESIFSSKYKRRKLNE
ncbi:unnamed protein product [Moneuplotes crassus]|uniref:Uncharacterized protein n=2 Tax=Euplotes crassus TaxID=5936 RepID=A0AAD1XUD3_EUPCR|nr:unnamed protein product [Moneuplotes crassus]